MMHWKPRGWMLAGALLAAIMATGPAATAQVATTPVADTIYRADGSPATGTVVISWPEFSTAAGQSVSAGSISAAIATGGALNVQLAPNAGSNPMGSYYTVVYHLNDGSVSREYWVIPVSTAPVKVSAIRSTVLPLSVAQNTVSKSYVDQAIANAVSGGLPQDTSQPYVLKTGDTMTGPLVLPADPVSPNQAADKHYVDTAVQQTSGGSGQKVSLLPQATQVVAQPVGTELQVNQLNGVEYATQYVTGNGFTNGIANAVTSADCASGCEVKAGKDYVSSETYLPAPWNDQTHVEDSRLGGSVDSYKNPANPLVGGLSSGRTIDLAATTNPAFSNGTVVSQTPNTIALNVTIEGMTGGSNLYPQSIEPTVPYFKSNYLAQDLRGVFNTQGQHSLSAEFINCYGVGDCLIGAHSIVASGGYRDEADEGAHPFDLTYVEDSNVFTGTCATGCAAGTTSLTITPVTGAGTQGEGRYLIDKNPAKVITAGVLTGGIYGSPYPSAVFSGTSFPVSVFFTTTQLAQSQANNIAPGTVTMPIATAGVTTGFATNTAAAPATSGVACVADQDPAGTNLPHNYEMARYTVIDGTHLRLTLGKVHAAGSTVAISGLCGYGLEQTVDTQAGIRQVFPVVGSYSATALYYAGGTTPIVGIMNQTSGFINISSPIASVTRAGNTVTLTATSGFPQDINGLAINIAGVADSSFNGRFTVTTTGSNTATYSQSGPDGSSSGGTLALLTGAYALYPMAETLGVMNAATKTIDGQMTLAPNTVAWAAGDPVEQPHYYQERIAADTEFIGQTVPRANGLQPAGMVYGGNNAQGLLGWEVVNATPASNYYGAGGSHNPPTFAYAATGVWQQTMNIDAGQRGVFSVNCNYRGCGRWNSTYDLFDLQSSAGTDTVRFQPQNSAVDINMRGSDYLFTPQSFTAGTINAGTLNAGTVNGHVSGNNITSGAVAAAYLPFLAGSGSGHGPGLAPDPGAVAGSTRFLREDGTWSVPNGSGGSNPTPVVPGGGNLVPGATADYNFLQGSGLTLTDNSGSGNNGNLNPSASPVWTATGLAFAPGLGVALPAALNNTQTFFLAIYMNPVTTSGFQPANDYPVLISNTQGGNGFNFMYNYSLPGLGDYIPFAYAPTFFVNNTKPTSSPNLISGFHVLAAVLGSGAGSLDHLYVDGVEVNNYNSQGTSAGAQAVGNFYLGSSQIAPWGTSGLNGTMYRVRLYPKALSATDVQSVTSAITYEVASRGVALTPTTVSASGPQLNAIGDSITFGLGANIPWPSLLAITNQQPYNVLNWGIPGIAIAALDGSEPNRAALHCHTSSGPALAIIFAGTNDFSLVGITPPQVLNNLLGEVQTMKQAGCRVFVGTMVSRAGNDANGNSRDADKNAYNTLIMSQAKAGGADGIIDFAANPSLGADNASNGPFFQPDHIHPNQNGQAILAAEASNVLNYTFGSNEASPSVVNALPYSMQAGDGYVGLSGLTGAGTITLPDCTGQSGAAYRINNPQSAFAVSVAPLNGSQLINGLGTATVPANSTLTLRDVPNPRAVSGCHWEM